MTLPEHHPRIAALITVIAITLVMGQIGAVAAYIVVHREVNRVCQTVNEGHLAIDGALNVQFLNLSRTVAADQAALHHPLVGANRKVIQAARLRTLHKDQANLAATAALIRHIHISAC